MQSIRKGTALLDREYPEWYKSIDLDHLDLAVATRCVLGQMFGYFIDGSKTLFGHHLGSKARFSLEVEYGFMTAKEDDEELGVDRAWSELTRRWKAAIRRRQRRS